MEVNLSVIKEVKEMSQPKIKICGLTTPTDAAIVNAYEADYAGFVLFYEKSKRYIPTRKVKTILDSLDAHIQSVAVSVSPTLEQLREIESLGFSILQVHGELSEEVLLHSNIPIWYAYNLDNKLESLLYAKEDKVTGYVIDGAKPGSGEPFSWSLLSNYKKGDKLFILAGGLDRNNVSQGIQMLHPDIVDVSSAVEGLCGKDEAKVKEFVREVRKNG